VTGPLELDAALEFAALEARRYLQGLSEEPVVPPGAEAAIERWSDPMPEDGHGALEALAELAARGRDAAMRSSGPRFFHFVMGGGTAAALGADWLTSAYDQVAYAWASSPFAARLEQAGAPLVLLRVDYEAGHGIGSTKAQRLAEYADTMAFYLWQFGIPAYQPPPLPASSAK